MSNAGHIFANIRHFAIDCKYCAVIGCCLEHEQRYCTR